MNEMPKNHQPSRLGLFLRWLFHRRTQGRILIGLATLITLVAVFYLEEDWRGKRAWVNCKRELEAKGEVLDWNAYIPPPVPDDQNFFKAPKMAEWFAGRGATALSKRLQSTNEDLTVSVSGRTNSITTTEAAKNYLDWSDQFEPDFDLIREALKRPYARMDGDYSQPYAVPIPNFVTVRAMAQMLAQRAHCYLLLNQPDPALSQLALLHNMCHLFEGAPTGKPMTLVAAMLNVAVTGLYADAVNDGFQRRAWQKPQLVALQAQLEQIHLPPVFVQAIKSEPAATTRTLETASSVKLRDWFSDPWRTSVWQKIMNLRWYLTPRGWIYQNMATSAKLVYQQAECFDPTNNTIQAEKIGHLTRELKTIPKPYRFMVTDTIPTFTRAWRTTAHNQTLVNEAQIACALERYRLAHGAYPKTLGSLVPQFIEKLPHDIIGGRPLHYRCTTDGKFLLYSVGWNEKDDGGTPGTQSNPKQGDWVWEYPAK